MLRLTRPRCAGCEEPLDAVGYDAGEGKLWHPECVSHVLRQAEVTRWMEMAMQCALRDLENTRAEVAEARSDWQLAHAELEEQRRRREEAEAWAGLQENTLAAQGDRLRFWERRSLSQSGSLVNAAEKIDSLRRQIAELIAGRDEEITELRREIERLAMAASAEPEAEPEADPPVEEKPPADEKPAQEMKRCNHCNRDLPATLEYFPKNPPSQGSGTLYFRCRECNRAKQNDRRQLKKAIREMDGGEQSQSEPSRSEPEPVKPPEMHPCHPNPLTLREKDVRTVTNENVQTREHPWAGRLRAIGVNPRILAFRNGLPLDTLEAFLRDDETLGRATAERLDRDLTRLEAMTEGELENLRRLPLQSPEASYLPNGFKRFEKVA